MNIEDIYMNIEDLCNMTLRHFITFKPMSIHQSTPDPISSLPWCGDHCGVMGACFLDGPRPKYCCYNLKTSIYNPPCYSPPSGAKAPKCQTGRAACNPKK